MGFLRLINVACALVALLPVLRLSHLIDSTCCNVVSIDFSKAMVFINSGLAGDYAPLLLAPSMSGHPQLVPLWIQFFFARVFELNAFSEYSCFTVMLCAAVLLIFDCLRTDEHKWSWVLLPIISFLQFSLCLSSEFFYCYSFMLDAVSRLSLALGLWSVFRVKSGWLAGILLFLAGFVCSSCMASFVIAYYLAVGLVIAALRRFEKPLLISYFLGAGVSALPVILVQAQGTFRADPGAAGTSSFLKFFATVGMAFLNDTASSVNVNFYSISLGVVGLCFLLGLSAYQFKISNIAKNVYCCWAIALFGLFNICCTSIGRVYISPWYCTFSIFVWTSICALALHSYFLRSGRYKFVAAFFAAAVLLFCLVFYVQTNRSYADKDFFRLFHSPCAESCLRNYRVAPTYCYYQLFGTKMGSMETYLKFGNDLSLYRLSCFSGEQIWSIQGDFILPVVQFFNFNSKRAVSWITGKKLQSKPFYNEPEHLTLAIPCKSKVVWQLNFPDEVNSINLLLDVAGQSALRDQKLVVKMVAQDGTPICSPKAIETVSDFKFSSIKIDTLGQKSIKLVFESVGGDDSGLVFLKYPRVRCVFAFTSPKSAPIMINTPSNLDNLPDLYGAISDVKMLAKDSRSWQLVDLDCADQSNFTEFRSRNGQARITYKRPLEIDPNYWSELFFEFYGDEKVKPRFVLCQFFFSNGKLKNAVIPIMPDSKSHRYRYELKLLQASLDERISFIQIMPAYESFDVESSFKLSNIGFARRLSSTKF